MTVRRRCGMVSWVGEPTIQPEIQMRLHYRAWTFVVILVAALTNACSTAPKTEGDMAKLSANADATLAGYKAKDTSLQGLLDKSVGYAVFPDIGKGGWI